MKFRKTMRRLAAFPVLTALLLAVSGCSNQVSVLNPKGPIAEQQRDLMIISLVLCCIVIVPVLILTAFIFWRYRDKKERKASYTPNWAHSTKLELVWWGIPIVIILILAVITAKSTYALEPSKPLKSDVKPLTVQVTSLNWKWLFQYPEQGIASVNELMIPEGVPIRFEITADSPMNSFWIPQLGGQMYAMSGMAMTLYLQADGPGHYWGSGANFTGTDFAKMYFDVDAVSKEQFGKWVDEVKTSSPALTAEGYDKLAEPSTTDKQTFSSFPEGLFEQTVVKYAASAQQEEAAADDNAAKADGGSVSTAIPGQSEGGNEPSGEQP
ncbi:ubiquinol oxidase subunit II [Paenibacillus physcomitrellae]|uniref:Quinol oxidase subunit 2 n=1 Tax=Paenibacillus physcomitrellae TaxID=1619311 RepID=A0ABQ1G3X3_9BACL|nr:ubiquinol oxidase subunit II [Paenibacillus physcomitrellae]GGA36919.1 ubiquinol oxidase subunit 2 [Paenibacillus physcomitrellae]